MDSYYTADHTSIDHIHADIKTCNTRETPQKYRTVQ